MALLTTIILAGYVIGGTFGAGYRQSDSISGSGFFNAFNYEAIGDPTHGRVNYVNSGTAQANNLTYASGDTFIQRSDYKTRLSNGGPGRMSVRPKSNKQYTTSVQIFNTRHMPQGCGTWPAVWTVGGDWPNQDEIDNLRASMAKAPIMLCCTPIQDVQCQPRVARLGPQLAIIAMSPRQITLDVASRWTMLGWLFWPRGSGSIPSEVANGGTSVNTDCWGTPTAYFPNTSCNIASKFGPHNIIINLTFCGDWAGAVYGSSGCPESCVDYVNNNPSAFTNACCNFAWIKVYLP